MKSNLFSILWKYRKLILIANTTVFIISIIISLLLPKWYRGSITFIVNDDATNPMMSSIANALPFNFMGNINEKVELYKNLITSRRILDSIDSLYNLQNLYDIDNRQKFYIVLKSDIEIRVNDDNTITLNFYYKEDAEQAAIIANRIFKELSDLSLELNSEKNNDLRIHLTNSYDLTIKRLREAEGKLTHFQVTNQIYDIETQIKLIINTLTELEINKIQTEIQMLFLKENLAQNNQEVQALQNKISIIQEKINEFKYSSSPNDLSLSQFPEKSVEYMNLFRDVKVYNKVLEFLIPQLENARIEEIKTASDIQLIDAAIAEDYKAKPKRIAVIFTICFIFFIIMILSILIHNYYQQNKSYFQNIKNGTA
jgi:capsule polysaccharide export protein KpsE/RkpR